MAEPSEPGSQPDPPAVAVTVVRTGGFAGIPREWHVEADASDAPGWVVLIEQCPWERCVQADAASGADRFTWELSATHGARRHWAELAEQQVTGPWRDLIDAVRQASGRSGTGAPSAAPPEP